MKIEYTISAKLENGTILSNTVFDKEAELEDVAVVLARITDEIERL